MWRIEIVPPAARVNGLLRSDRLLFGWNGFVCINFATCLVGENVLY